LFILKKQANIIYSLFSIVMNKNIFSPTFETTTKYS